MPTRCESIQAALVATAVATPDDVASAWALLPDDFDLDEIRSAARLHLVAVAASQLDHASVHDPALPRMRGVIRRNWVQQQLIAIQMGETCRRLRSAGVTPWVSGGLASAIGQPYGSEPGVRAVDDTVLMVAPVQASDALDVLGAADWTVPFTERRLARRLQEFSSVKVCSPDGLWTELAWHPSPLLDRSATWSNESVEVDVAGESVAVLVPATAIVQSCVNGWGLRRGEAIWIADVQRMLPLVERAALDAEAERFGVSEMVASALELVDAAVAAGSGDAQALRRLRDGLAAIAPPAGVLAELRHAMNVFAAPRSGRQTARAFPDLLADRWFLDRRSQLPAALLARVKARIRPSVDS